MDVLAVLIASLVFAPSVVAFVDAQRFPDRAWRSAGRSLLLWTAVIVLLPLVGPLLFVSEARPALARGLRETSPNS